MVQDYPNDVDLARLAKGGDGPARTHLVQRLACVESFLRVRNQGLGHPLGVDDLADVTQEATRIIWQKLLEFRGEATLETWCCAIGYKVLYRAVLRSRSQAIHLSDLGSGFDVAVRECEPMAYECVEWWLRHLRPGESEVVKARVLDGRDFEEIADQAGMSKAALKARYYRALNRLARRLGGTVARGSADEESVDRPT